MVEVGVSEARRRLTQLIDAALGGEDVILTRGNRRVRLSVLQDAPHALLDTLDFAERVRQTRERFAGSTPPLTEAEFQAERSAIRGRD